MTIYDNMVHYLADRQIQERHEPAPEPALPPANLGSELAAMQTIAVALSALASDEDRARVLRWASERFGAPQAVRPTSPVRERANDIDGLDDLFERRDDDSLSLELTDRSPLPAMMKDLVADFQRLAREWHGQ
jgi:hypothetical protein